MDNFFATARPEEVGIESQHITNFMKKLEVYNLTMHSILLIRHGKLVAEAYYAPYTANTLHRMFSVTKSFTALGIGLLAEEGKLSLEDRIIDHFPEKLPSEGVHPYIAEITIGDMLMMSTAHEKTTYKRWPDGDWVKSFFAIEPSHIPGTVFSYDTSSSHTLAALVEKLSGMSLLDYLRSKFLDEIGFSKDAYIKTDPMGIAQGGSGLMALPIDLAKVAWVVMQEGCYQGKQYLPKEFIQEAVKKQIETVVRGLGIDERQGYGYQFWRVRNNGYAMFGMGGQFAVCFPEQDLILVTTADLQEQPYGATIMFEAFYSEIFDKLADQPLPANAQAWAELQATIEKAAIKPLTGNKSSLTNSVNQQQYIFPENQMGLKSIKLELGDQQGKLYYTNQTGSHQLVFGLEELVVSQFPHYNWKCASSAAWADQKTLVIKSHIIDEEIGTITIQLAFKDSRVTVYMKKVIESGFSEFSGFVSGKLA